MPCSLKHEKILSILESSQLEEATEEKLIDYYVTPPAFGSGGRLEFKYGEVQFDADGKLKLLCFLPDGQTNRWLWLGKEKSVVSTNQAF